MPEAPLPSPAFTSWPTFPFEGELRVKKLDDPVDVEPARHGEDPAECTACRAPDSSYIWVSERWRVRSLEQPTGLPMVLILESRSHLDLGDLPNMLAAELGVLTVRLERAIRSLDGVARVHVNRWGDGSAHLHVWFLARPYGRLQLRGTFLSLWDDILPRIPESQWRDNLALVAEWLAEFGGRALAEPPRIDWQAPSAFAPTETDAFVGAEDLDGSGAAPEYDGHAGTSIADVESAPDDGLPIDGVEQVSADAGGARPQAGDEAAVPEQRKASDADRVRAWNAEDANGGRRTSGARDALGGNGAGDALGGNGPAGATGADGGVAGTGEPGGFGAPDRSGATQSGAVWSGVGTQSGAGTKSAVAVGSGGPVGSDGAIGSSEAAGSGAVDTALGTAGVGGVAAGTDGAAAVDGGAGGVDAEDGERPDGTDNPAAAVGGESGDKAGAAAGTGGDGEAVAVTGGKGRIRGRRGRGRGWR